MKEKLSKMPRIIVVMIAISAVMMAIQLVCVLAYLVVSIVNAIPAPVYIIAAVGIVYKFYKGRSQT